MKKNFDLQYYQTKKSIIAGTNYKEIYKKVWREFIVIKKKTKRRAYIRSAYFKKEKIFFDYFWLHLKQKREKDKVRRLKYFICAIDVMKNSKLSPEVNYNRNKANEIFYKFFAMNKIGKIFFVQIKENKKTGAKYFMSCFPGK